MHNQANTQPRGIILILALLVVSTILLAAAAFAGIINRELQQARLLDQSVQALYAAESGVERSLFHIRQRLAVATCDDGATCQAGVCDGSAIACFDANDSALLPRGDWNMIIDPEGATTVNLQRGQSFQVDLFGLNQVSDAGITGFQLSSDVNNIMLFGQITNLTNILQVQAASCPTNSPAVAKDVVEIVDSDNTEPYTSPVIGSLDGVPLYDSCSYIVRVSRPLTDIAESANITLTALSNSAEVPIPSRLIVTGTGESGNAAQRITTRTPIRPPLSGLYDFVLFSEEAVIK